MKTCSKRFTLIELLVVISIIVILLSILLPSLRTALFRARLVLCKNNQKQQYLCLGNYCDDNNRRYPTMPMRDGYANAGIILTEYKPPYLNGNMGTVYEDGYIAGKAILQEPGTYMYPEGDQYISNNTKRLRKTPSTWVYGSYAQHFMDYGYMALNESDPTITSLSDPNVGNYKYNRIWGRSPSNKHLTGQPTFVTTTAVMMCAFERKNHKIQAHRLRRVNVLYEQGHVRDLNCFPRIGSNTNNQTVSWGGLDSWCWWRWAMLEDQ